MESGVVSDENSEKQGGRDFRLPFALLVLAALAFFFWLSSRYPALNEKALMGGDTPVSGLSFDILYEIIPGSSIWWELVANSANWIYTNLKGMTFGVLFGAAALTTLSVIKKRSFENAFANSALGTVIGAPLGVCVNCAVPIAMGLHMGRMRLETTLSAMLASPTLNVIVITMSFALLPVHLAVIKVLLALVMVLLIVPLLCKYVLKAETDSTRHNVSRMVEASKPTGFTSWVAKALSPDEYIPAPHGPLAAFVWFLRTYGRSFFFIFIITVPMMLLAAVLGAVVATFTSPNELATLFPHGNIILVLLAMLAIAAVASFVPAPIALDVILTVILFNIGMRADYAMVALIALGSFSVYAFIILWRVISLRTAMAIWAAVIILALAGGIIANRTTPYVDKYYKQQQRAALFSVDKVDWPVPEALPSAKTLASLEPILSAQQIVRTDLRGTIESSKGSNITATVALPRAASKTGAKESAFARVVGTEIGLAEKGVNSPLREFGFGMIDGGLAAGDVHGDGWIDIVTHRPEHATGLSLYANIGGRFERQQLDLGPVDDLEVINLALADIDGDARLDMLVSTIAGGDFLFFNEGMGFSKANMVRTVKAGHAVTTSFAFADLDRDGDLDIVNGRWAPRGVAEGWGARPKDIRNQILWNEGERAFRTQKIDGVSGQTFAILIADFDGDGIPDIFNGDDAGPTDGVSFLDADGNVRDLPVSAQPFPYHIWASMSYDEGDWNNDLRPDYYGVQISSDNKGQTADSNNRLLYELCAQFAADIGWDTKQTAQCAKQLLSIDSIRNGKSAEVLDGCTRPTAQQDRALCGALAMISAMNKADRKPEGDRKRYEACILDLQHIPELQHHCGSLLHELESMLGKEEMASRYREGLNNGNILMTSQGDGTFADKGIEANVRKPGWGWNSRFFDLDQDSRQDILVMTGIWLNPALSTTNVFYRNTGGSFEDATDDYGFHDIVPSYGYVNLDYDRDGDIDVVRDIASMRMIVHRNDRPVGPALFVKLRDRKGNSMGIGAKVTICTDGEQTIRPGKCQMRYMRASGGFMSSNPIQAHFGLGKANSVSLIQVIWPDGEESMIRPTTLEKGEVTISRS